jgi:hypothetical protein
VRVQGTERGTCPFCGARHVQLIPIQDLSEPFSNVLSEYVDESYRANEVLSGEHHWAATPLKVALQDDWGVFSSVILAKKNDDLLLERILATTKDRIGESLKPNSWVLRFSLQAMSTEWRFWGRMFPEGSLPQPKSLDMVREEIEVLGTSENQAGKHLSYFAVLIGTGKILCRSRPGCEAQSGTLMPHQDLGPNPAHPASRANSDAQYAIYLSEAELIAVAEIRQPVGSFISVGEFVVTRDLSVVDLCQSLAAPNPFVTKNLPWILDLTRLLSGIAGTMSKPSQTSDDYFTTQLLANIARALGYDGIRYPSALNSAERNLVLFDRHTVSQRASWVNVLKNGAFQRL